MTLQSSSHPHYWILNIIPWPSPPCRSSHLWWRVSGSRPAGPVGPPWSVASMQKPRLGQTLHLVKNVSVTGAPRDPPDIIIAWRPHFSCHNNNKLKTREILQFLYLPLVNVFVMIIFWCFLIMMITLELLMRFPSGTERCWSAVFFYLYENYPRPFPALWDYHQPKHLTLSVDFTGCISFRSTLGLAG